MVLHIKKIIILLLITSIILGCHNATSSSSSSNSTSIVDSSTDPTAITNPEPASGISAFVDNYTTQTSANTSESTNAGLRLLAGFDTLWTSGGSAYSTVNSNYLTAYKTGSVVNSTVLSANVVYTATTESSASDTQLRQAWIDDRTNQSYTPLEGLGPLMQHYISGSGATTSITRSTSSVPSTSDSTSLAASDSTASSNNVGSTSSSLGNVESLVLALRGSYASTTPAKYYFNYPRPWRLDSNSAVEETSTVSGSTTTYSYVSPVSVDPYDVVNESTTPYKDGGFPSGHTNAGYLAALAYAYAMPERYQELITRASALGQNRMIAGMHSPLDVMGGRILATALAAATLNDSSNATLKANAFTQAHTYLETATSTSGTGLYDYAHETDSSNYSSYTTPYSDHDTNKSNYVSRLTNGFSAINSTSAAAIVPKGAEVLLETRFPYLTTLQVREILRTTEISSGYPLLDGDNEGWGRLNLFAAVDGFGSFNGSIYVNMDSALTSATHNGFYTRDYWKNNISGSGRLIKQGSGTLILTGSNTYSGGTRIEAGNLQGTSSSAFGSGDVYVKGGVLELNAAALTIAGKLKIGSSGTITSDLNSGSTGLLTVKGTASLSGTFNAVFTSQPASGTKITLINANSISGKFSYINYSGLTTYPTASYTSNSVILTF